MGLAWKWTAKNKAKVLDALRQGHSRTSAAGTIGGSLARLSQLIKEDSEFSDAVLAAEAEAAATAQGIAWPWPPPDADTARAWQRKRHAAEWGDKQTVEATVNQRMVVTWEFVDEVQGEAS